MNHSKCYAKMFPLGTLNVPGATQGFSAKPGNVYSGNPFFILSLKTRMKSVDSCLPTIPSHSLSHCVKSSLKVLPIQLSAKMIALFFFFFPNGGHTNSFAYSRKGVFKDIYMSDVLLLAITHRSVHFCSLES